jgi:hypothetical protein
MQISVLHCLPRKPGAQLVLRSDSHCTSPFERGLGYSMKPQKSDADKLANVREVRRTFGSQAARELYLKLGLPSTPAMRTPSQLDLFRQ